MLRNILKIAWRTALRQKLFTGINILGLSIGIAVCLLMGMYIQDEYTFDRFHVKADRLYRISQPLIWDDFEGKMGTTGPNVAVALRADVPEFEAVTRILDPGAFAVAHKTTDGTVKSFLQNGLLVAEENFFDLFSFKLKKGDTQTALDGPAKVVISEKLAEIYFGINDPIGKTLEIKGTILEGNKEKEELWKPFVVTGVVENVPRKSHIQFDLLTSMSSYPEIKASEWTWSWTAFANYGLVKEGTDILALEKKLQNLAPKWAATTLKRIFNDSFEQLKARGKKWSLYLDPIEDIYLKEQEAGNSLGATANIQYIKVFSFIGLLILILSSINFMNLATAQSARRGKEVGVRKVLGSERTDLIKQFVAEAFLYTFVSALIAIIITRAALGLFNDIAAKTLDLNTQLGNPIFLLGFILFIFLLGLLTSTYPAFYLSSFRPVQVLKGKMSNGLKRKNIRNALVVAQFTISIALIISTFFVKRQLDFASDFNIGYNKDNVIQLHNIEQHTSNVEVLKNIFKNKKGITAVGQSHEVPPNMLRKDFITRDGLEKEIQVSRMKSDKGYIELLDLKFLAGRNFTEERVTDKQNGVILNAAAIKALGWEKEDLMTKTVERYGTKLEVIGVVEDFHYNSLKEAIYPLIIYHIDNPYLPDSGTSPAFLSMRIDKEAVHNNSALQFLIKDIKADLLAMDAAFPYEFSFMDAAFEQAFRAEQRMSQLLNLFTFIAVFIACIGLFGLTAFAAEQRTKEFGIRKVLGASALQLMTLFSFETLKLIGISFFIAAPLAYLFINDWLTNFAYKTPIEISVFILAGICAFAIAMLTVGYQSVKAAVRNPIDSLKVE